MTEKGSVGDAVGDKGGFITPVSVWISYQQLISFSTTHYVHVFAFFASLKVIRVNEAEFIPITSSEFRLQYNLDLFGTNAKDHTLLSEDYVGLRLFEACSKRFKEEKQMDFASKDTAKMSGSSE